MQATLSRESRPPLAEQRNSELVVHVVGNLTTAAVQNIQAAWLATGYRSMRQALLYVDNPCSREHVDTLPAGLQLVKVPSYASPLRLNRHLAQELVTLTRQSRIVALLVHGIIPGIAAARAIRAHTKNVASVQFFATGSSPIAASQQALVGLLNLHFRRRQIGTFKSVHSPSGPHLRHAIDRREGAAPRAAALCLYKPRDEALTTVLVGGNLVGHKAAMEAYVRIAVLLGDDRLGITFQWCGATTFRGAEAARAARIHCLPMSTVEARVDQLALAWAYIAPVETADSAERIAEAMCGGVACVALNTESHRALIRHGETGFLCDNIPAMLMCIAKIIDSRQVRLRIGFSARQDAIAKWGRSSLDNSLDASHTSP